MSDGEIAKEAAVLLITDQISDGLFLLGELNSVDFQKMLNIRIKGFYFSIVMMLC